MSKTRLADQLFDKALEAREAYARDLYDVDEVMMRLKRAAENGDTHLRLKQDRPHDLQLTDAAIHLVAVLQGRGFGCKWFAVSLPEKINGQLTGRDLGFLELTIDWRGEETGLSVEEGFISELQGCVEVRLKKSKDDHL